MKKTTLKYIDKTTAQLDVLGGHGREFLVDIERVAKRKGSEKVKDNLIQKTIKIGRRWNKKFERVLLSTAINPNRYNELQAERYDHYIWQVDEKIRIFTKMKAMLEEDKKRAFEFNKKLDEVTEVFNNVNNKIIKYRK